MSVEAGARTRFPRIVRRDPHHAPSDMEYVRIAIFLAVITGIEVAIAYSDIAKVILVLALVVLAAIKFVTVAAFFMHLKFDGRLLTYTFGTGLVGAVIIFSIVIWTLNGIP